MAKSARSSDRKRNNANLRARVFGPAHDARTARLSAKLQELASKPKPDQEKMMDVDGDGETDAPEASELAADHDVDVAVVASGPASHNQIKKAKTSSRIEKHSRRKPRNKVVFPTSAAKKKRIAQSKKKSA